MPATHETATRPAKVRATANTSAPADDTALLAAIGRLQKARYTRKTIEDADRLNDLERLIWRTAPMTDAGAQAKANVLAVYVPTLPTPISQGPLADAIAYTQHLLSVLRPAELRHACAEVGELPNGENDFEKATAVFHAFLDQLEAAAAAILDVEAHDLAEARIKLHAFLMVMAALRTSPRERGDMSLETAMATCARGANVCGEDEASNPALVAYVADVERLTAPPTTPDPTLFAEAAAAFQAAHAEMELVGLELDAAHAAVEAEAPTPEVLKQPGGGRYTSEQWIINDPDLSFDEKATKVAALREWLPRREAAIAKHNPTDEAYDAADLVRADARDAMIDVPATTLAEVVQKLRHWISEAHIDRIGQDVDTPETIAELLTSPTLDGGWAPVRIYQDLLRLAGQRPDLVSVTPFDGDAWIEAFEQFPGHRATDDGRIEYAGDEAFGAPPYEAFRVTDLDAIGRYHAVIRDFYSDEESWVANCKKCETSLVLNQRQAVAWLYPDGGAEHDRLLALWDERHEKMRGSPLGADLWFNLTDWQKAAVRRAAKIRGRARRVEAAQ